MRKLFIVVIILCCTSGFVITGHGSRLLEFFRPPNTIPAITSPQVIIPDTIKIVGVGDVMMGTNYPSEKYLPPNDGKDLFSTVIPFISRADIAFANAEGTFLDSGGTVKQCQDPTKCYAFRQPVRYARYLADAGFDLISLANNHSGDFGSQGRFSSIDALTSNGMSCAGLLSIPTTITERNGIKYGLAAFAPNTGTVDIRDIDGAKKIVSDLATQCDIVIVSFHGGAEGPDHQRVSSKTEIFYGENRGNVVEFSHAVIDAGADIVFGHGPHVTRAIELYNDRLVAYSLGNFCTYARFNLDGPNGIAPLLEVNVDSTGQFLDGKIIAVKQVGEGGPQIDEENKVIDKIVFLTLSDFPGTPLRIFPNGDIKRKIISPE